MNIGWFRLDENHNVIPDERPISERHLDDDARRRVAETTIGESWISTVFLMLDHGFGDTPLFFETLVFGGPEHSSQERCGPWEGYQERCATWAEAEAMHERICQMIRKNPNGLQEC